MKSNEKPQFVVLNDNLLSQYTTIKDSSSRNLDSSSNLGSHNYFMDMEITEPKNPNCINEISIKIDVTTVISKRITELENLLKNIHRNNVSIDEQQLLLQYNKKSDFPSVQWFAPTLNLTTDLEQTCRLCVHSMTPLENRVSLFLKTTENNVDTAFEELNNMNLKIYRDDGLPQNICALCVARLEQLKEFRLQATRAQFTLQGYFERIVKTNNLNDTLDPNQHTEDVGIAFLKDEPIEIVDSSELVPPLDDTRFDKCLYQCFKDIESIDKINNDCETTFQEARNQLDHTEICMKPELEPTSEPMIQNDELQISNNSPRKYKCQYCEKLFTRPQYVRRHEFTHKGARFFGEIMFVCDICNQRFVEKVQLKAHIWRDHIQMSKTNTVSDNIPTISLLPLYYNCDICNKRFRYHTSLTNHLAKHEGEEERKFVCEFCKQKFKREVYLRSHVHNVHLRMDRYKCGLCEKTFNQQDNLSDHVATMHGTEYNYECLQCFKKEPNRNALRQHMKTHTDEIRYQCDGCGARIAEYGEMSNHMIKGKCAATIKPLPYPSVTQ